MLNGLRTIAEQDAAAGADARPGLRLSGLFAAMLIPLAAVVGRVVWLQTRLADEYVAAFDFTTETTEPIPSRDGRILGSDGRVLAYDAQRYQVQAHYRWLEEPADPLWLKRSALARLDRRDRRRAERIAAERERTLQERRDVWIRLSQIGGVSAAELAVARGKIQARVERIVELVEGRRTKAADDADDDASRSPLCERSLWNRWGRALRRTLTTPPQRVVREPVVVAEEQDYHVVLDDVPRAAAAEIAANPQRYPGLRVVMSAHRVYPQGKLAAHVVGVRLPADSEVLKQRGGKSSSLDYRSGDRLGRTGVERSYDRVLRGTRGLRKVVKNRRGEIIRTEITRQPRPGRDVVLALDLPLQERAEQLLEQALREVPAKDGKPADPPPLGGCIVVLDVHSGRVVVASSAPGFDVMQLVGPQPEEWKRLNSDPRRPFFPRATRMALPPGSVFKAIAAAAILESGKVDPDAPFGCRGYLDRPGAHRCLVYRRHGVGHGETTLADAIGRSCNVYFFAAARTIGADALIAMSDRFGIGRPSGVDLPGEAGGHLPRPKPGFPAGRRSGWQPGDTLGLAIGQSRLTVTPLQMARMMAAIANGGRLVIPRVVSGLGQVQRSGSQTDRIADEGESLAVTAANLNRIREGLSRVVNHPSGTAYKHVRVKAVAIAGKTGTAEVGGERPDHAWFCGYVPASRPRYAFAVVLEHGGSGGAKAGPIARKLVQSMLATGMIEPPVSQAAVRKR